MPLPEATAKSEGCLLRVDHFLGTLCPGFKGYVEQAYGRLAILKLHCSCPTLYPKSPKSVLSEKASPGCGGHTAGCQSRDRCGSRSSELCWFRLDNPLIYRRMRVQVLGSLTEVLLNPQLPCSPPPPAPSLGAGTLPLIPVPGFSLQLWASLHTHEKSA